MIRCHFCVSGWVDRALNLAGVPLTDLGRRRLIASLLSRPHLILTGASGIGKTRLARALAVSGVGGQKDRACHLQGHPWWAANTADVSHFVELQTDYSLSRLAQFTRAEPDGFTPAWAEMIPRSQVTRSHEKRTGANREGMAVCRKTVYVERMSPLEVELYFGIVARWLAHNTTDTEALPIRLIGTYDADVPLMLDEHTRRLVAQLHLGHCCESRIGGRDPRNGSLQNRLLTCL